MSLIVADRLTRRFGMKLALDSLTLTVAAGEVVCLLGANGAGKSTAINLLLGFLQPTTGEALIDGVSISRNPAAARRALAYIPEQIALFPSLSGVENLDYFTRLSGVKLTRKSLRDALAAAGLDAADHERRAGAYSKGMRQKVGIAIALAKRAKALLLDEPLSGLDPVAANGLSALLRERQTAGCAVLMATHDVFRAKEIATRIGIMKAGRLVDLIDGAGLGAEEVERIYLSHMREPAAA